MSTSVPSGTTSSSALHFKVRTGSHISSSLKNTSSSSYSAGRPPTAIMCANLRSGGSSFSSAPFVPLGKPAGVQQAGAGRPKNTVGRPSNQIAKLQEEAAAAAHHKRKALSQEGEHSGPERNCIFLQDRGRTSSFASSSSSSSSSSPSFSKVPTSSFLAHGQTNGTLCPSSKARAQPSLLNSHSSAAKAVWTYKRTHPPLVHSSPRDPSSATNSHSRSGMGDSGLHGNSSGRGLEHQGLVKKRKAGGIKGHSPSSKLSAQRLPSSSSSSNTLASPRSNFYPWKDGKGGGLAGGVDKKLGTQKVGLLEAKLGTQLLQNYF